MLGFGKSVPVGAHGFEQAEGADDVGLDEVFRAMDAAIDVGFGGEVDDGAGLVFGEQFGDQVEVFDVAFDEDVARIALQRGQVLQVAGVGEGIEVEDRLAGTRYPVQDKVCADEAGATGDENHVRLCIRKKRIQPLLTRL